jgi:group I intron endonuclease
MIIKDWELPENRLFIRSKYKNKSGIYCLESKLDNRVYIGSSKNIGRRISEHYNNLINNTHSNKKLQNFINKYTTSQLILHIVIISTDRNALFNIETEFIKFLNCCENGFNLSSTSRGGISSKEQKLIVGQRMKLVNTGKICTEEHKRKVGKAKSIQNKGSKNPNAKLKEENIVEIRLMWENGSMYEEIMNKFNIKTKSQLWRIINKKVWKHVV